MVPQRDLADQQQRLSSRRLVSVMSLRADETNGASLLSNTRKVVMMCAFTQRTPAVKASDAVADKRAIKLWLILAHAVAIA